MFRDVLLDARMNQQDGIPAQAWLRTVTVEELASAIGNYGKDGDALLNGISAKSKGDAAWVMNSHMRPSVTISKTGAYTRTCWPIW